MKSSEKVHKNILFLPLLFVTILSWFTADPISIIMGADAWSLGISSRISRQFSARHLSSSSSDADIISNTISIGIVGGGLAGLSTAYYLLQRAPDTKITIFDKEHPGFGGASAVAGGYVNLKIVSPFEKSVKDVIIICYSSLSLAHDDTTYNQDR